MFDLYKETKRLADDLEEQGVQDWPQRLRAAIEGGATGGEIVMAIRWEVTRMITSSNVLTSPYEGRAWRIIAEANRALHE